MRTNKEALQTAINNWLQSFEDSDDGVPYVVSFVDDPRNMKILVTLDNELVRAYSYEVMV